MAGLIDLNTVDDDEAPQMTGPSPSSSPCNSSSAFSASNSNASFSSSAANVAAPGSPYLVSLELWKACAGPLISLPRKGSGVVYFPQGQLEQSSDLPVTDCHLPPHVFCRVVEVKLYVRLARVHQHIITYFKNLSKFCCWLRKKMLLRYMVSLMDFPFCMRFID